MHFVENICHSGMTNTAEQEAQLSLRMLIMLLSFHYMEVIHHVKQMWTEG